MHAQSKSVYKAQDLEVFPLRLTFLEFRVRACYSFMRLFDSL